MEAFVNPDPRRAHACSACTRGRHFCVCEESMFHEANPLAAVLPVSGSAILVSLNLSHKSLRAFGSLAEDSQFSAIGATLLALLARIPHTDQIDTFGQIYRACAPPSHSEVMWESSHAVDYQKPLSPILEPRKGPFSGYNSSNGVQISGGYRRASQREASDANRAPSDISQSIQPRRSNVMDEIFGPLC